MISVVFRYGLFVVVRACVPSYMRAFSQCERFSSTFIDNGSDSPALTEVPNVGLTMWPKTVDVQLFRM